MVNQPLENLSNEAIKTVTEKFLQRVGSKKEPILTKSEFSTFVTAKNAFYSERLFAIIPKSESQCMTLKELLDFLSEFTAYDNGQKINFLFKLFDKDDNGKLDISELHEMLEVSILENGIELDKGILDDLTSALLGHTDDEEFQRNELNKEDFHKLFENHQELLDSIATIIEKLMMSIKRTSRKDGCSCGFLRRSMKALWNNYFLVVWILFYFGLNLTLFIYRFVIFRRDFEQLGDRIYLGIARSAGFCLDFNCGLILVTMVRHSLTRLRATKFGRLFPIDHHRFFHELTATMIIIFASIHMIAHILNIAISILPKQPNGFSLSALLVFMFSPSSSLSLGLIPGIAYISGFALTAVLVVITLLALPVVRSNGYFHLFYLSHNILYPIFLGLTVLHCKNFWKWLILPGTIFIIEQLYRLYNTWIISTTNIMSGIPLQSKVTLLSIRRPHDFEFNCGDYVFIRIPKFSKFEWHPFTISSAPENRDEITLHIQAVGPWTISLYEHFEYLKIRTMDVVHKFSFRSSFEHLDSVDRLVSTPIPSTSSRSGIRAQTLPVGSRLQKEDDNESDSENNTKNKKDIHSRLSSRNSFKYLQRKYQYVNLRNRRHRSLMWGELEATVSTISSTVPYSSIPIETTKASIVDDNSLFSEEQLTVQLDGPYGAPACSIYNVEHAVLIGAGIGVTPFASILQSLMYRHWESKVTCSNCNHTFSHGFQGRVNRLKKVDFHWINKDRKAFGWFYDLLSKLEIIQEEMSSQQKVEGTTEDRFLDIYMHLTRALKRNDMRAVALHLAMDLHYLRSKKDVLAGLKSRVKAGRPNWKEVFQQIEATKKGNVVVFFCGPPMLGSTLKKMCQEFNFDFRTEVF